MAKALALARRSHVAAALGFRTRRAFLLLAAPAFCVAQASPRFVPTSIPRFFSRRISFSPFSVSVLGCGVASPSALEISLVSEWMRRVYRSLRIDRAVFLHRPARE